MENENKMTAQEAKTLWANALVYGGVSATSEEGLALQNQYYRLRAAEVRAMPKPSRPARPTLVRVESSRMRNGRLFRVAIYSDGTTMDLD